MYSAGTLSIVLTSWAFDCF